MVLWAWLVASANASGLDQLEVGGLWGHPLATDATALHWNPAGLAAESGSTFMLEGAPQFAAVEFERHHEYFGGHNSYRTMAVAPFAAVKTRIGNLGLGIGLAVPYGKSSRSQDGDFGVASYTLVGGGSFTAALQAGAAYNFGDRVQVGASFSTLYTSFDSQVNMSLVPEIVSTIGTKHYTEAYLEDPNYATTTRANGLTGLGFSGSFGVRAKLSDSVALGVSYLHGSRVDVSGSATQSFGCGREDDAVAQASLTLLGLCNAELNTQMSTGWNLPWRGQMAMQWSPNDALDLTMMGAFVRWSRFQNYDIQISDVAKLNDVAEMTAAGLETPRTNARDNRDTFWVAVDGKMQVSDRLLLGGRVTYDHPAVPKHALSANNFDGPTVLVGVLGAYRVAGPIQVGLGLTHQFIAPRTVSDGAFSLALDKPEGEDARWFWANNNGKYGGRITRLGLSIRGHFGGAQ